MKKIRAFTLIELLTVIAITAVLLTLIVLPLFQSFNSLRQGQAFADAQDKGRLLVERISREVGNAITVRAGTGTVATKVNGTNALVPTSSLVIRVPNKARNAIVETLLPESKLDLVPPAQGDPTRGPNGGFVDPVTGKEDPTLSRPKGDVNLPGRPGQTIVRWFIGLNRAVTDPGSNGEPQPINYNEPYSGLLMARDGSRDNLYVIRRAEVQPYRANGTVNTDFFVAGANGRIADFDDPRFFIADGADAGKNRRVLAWQKASVVQTELSRYDAVRPVTTGKAAEPVVTYGTVYGTPNVPLMLPLVQFRPTRVASSPASGTAAAQPGQAVDGLESIGPDTYQTDRGLWTNTIVRYYPGGYDPTGTALQKLMEVASVSSTGSTAIFQGASSPNGLDDATGTALFDITAYEAALTTTGTYLPFSAAVANNAAWLSDATARATFVPFRVLTGTGKIVTSFPIEEVGVPQYDNTATPPVLRPNLPSLRVQTSESPTQASGYNASLSPITSFLPYAKNAGYNANLAYNRMFNGDPDATGKATRTGLQPLAQRFIDLRLIPNADGTPSPLCPESVSGQITGFNTIVQPARAQDGSIVAADSGGRMNRVRITPGSEVVYGPDQNTTGGYAGRVRYTRVSGQPGPNQYRLVYADRPEPTSPTTGLVDYSILGVDTTGFNPASYDPANVVSAQIQPQFKAGYLQLDSDPNVPLPVGDITVSYRFQFNGPSDSFAVDYDTREVMQILLTIKNFPQSSVPSPQVVTLKATATLRNALR